MGIVVGSAAERLCQMSGRLYLLALAQAGAQLNLSAPTQARTEWRVLSRITLV